METVKAKRSILENGNTPFILGYGINGEKDILGLWIGESGGKHYWMQVFDEIRACGVEDVLFISMDGVSSLEEGAKSIFRDVVVQCCIVHLVRNSTKYVPTKDYKKFTAHLKKIKHFHLQKESPPCYNYTAKNNYNQLTVTTFSTSDQVLRVLGFLFTQQY